MSVDSVRFRRICLGYLQAKLFRFVAAFLRCLASMSGAQEVSRRIGRVQVISRNGIPASSRAQWPMRCFAKISAKISNGCSLTGEETARNTAIKALA